MPGEGDAGRRWSRSQGGRAHPRGALGPGKEGTRRPSGGVSIVVIPARSVFGTKNRSTSHSTPEKGSG